MNLSKYLNWTWFKQNCQLLRQLLVWSQISYSSTHFIEVHFRATFPKWCLNWTLLNCLDCFPCRLNTQWRSMTRNLHGNSVFTSCFISCLWCVHSKNLQSSKRFVVFISFLPILCTSKKFKLWEFIVPIVLDWLEWNYFCLMAEKTELFLWFSSLKYW